jgi:MFS family permease
VSRNVAQPKQPGSTLLITGLALAVANLSVLQTLVVPVLSTIASQLGESLAATGWALTANLLAAAVATPVLGRLGDVYGKRPVMIGILGTVLAGSVLALLTSSLPLLLLARVMQGASYGLFPLSMSVLRDEVPAERLTTSMALVSATLGVGGVIGLLSGGLLTRGGADYHRIFWVAIAMTAISLVLAFVSLPAAQPQPNGSIDWLGVLVLSAGLVLLLLPISQGHVWGWAAPTTIGCFVAAAVVLTGFVLLERRVKVPLARPELLGSRRVIVPNLSGLLVGFTLFTSFLSVTGFVETPRAVAGYGFTASVLTASAVFLLPGAVVGVVLAPFLGRLVHRIGAYRSLTLGASCGLLGFGGMAVLHDATWQIIVTSTLIQVAVTFAFATLPALIVQAVEPADTGIANSVNSIARSVGSAVGSALAVTLLTGMVADGTGLPREAGYVTIMGLGAGAFALILLMTLLAPRSAPRPDPLEEAEEAQALAGEFSTVSGLR